MSAPSVRDGGAHRDSALRYGRVFFALRRRFLLSASECLLADVIDTLSLRTGWCFASRRYLASLLGVSVRSLQRMIVRLEERGLLERHPTLERYLRPTVYWRRAKASLGRVNLPDEPGHSGTEYIKRDTKS